MSIVQMSISAAVLVLVIVVIRALAINKLPKSTFKVLWSIVLVRLLLPIKVESPFSVYSLINRFTARDLTANSGPVLQTPITTIDGSNQLPVVPQEIIPVSPFALIWFLGMIACALFFAIAYFKCLKEFQSSMPVENIAVLNWLETHKIIRSIQIRQSGKISAPLTYGVFKPVILLPKTIDWGNTKQIEYILTHEHVHICRFDTLYKLLLTFVVCIHWFNPLVWVMFILANRDIELSCDERVIQIFGEEIKSYYAHTLIDMEEKKSTLPPYVITSVKMRLKKGLCRL